jgi:hypothetical protein
MQIAYMKQMKSFSIHLQFESQRQETQMNRFLGRLPSLRKGAGKASPGDQAVLGSGIPKLPRQFAMTLALGAGLMLGTAHAVIPTAALVSANTYLPKSIEVPCE